MQEHERQEGDKPEEETRPEEETKHIPQRPEEMPERGRLGGGTEMEPETLPETETEGGERPDEPRENEGGEGV